MLKKLALVLCTIGVAASASAQTSSDIMANKPYSAYAQDARGIIVRSTYGLCWRTGFWTPADAVVGCDGVLAPPVAKSIAPTFVAKPDPTPTTPTAVTVTLPPAAPAVVEKPAPTPAPKPVIVTEKFNLEADALFDSGKADLKPAGKTKIDELVAKLKGFNLESITATGHTDSVGAAEPNQKLSVKRAESVKAYLVSKGIDTNRIRTDGKGETQPIAGNKTATDRAKNRRVELDITGSRNK
jgi:OOP family OmpA-OmpF porin